MNRQKDTFVLASDYPDCDYCETGRALYDGRQDKLANDGVDEPQPFFAFTCNDHRLQHATKHRQSLIVIDPFADEPTYHNRQTLALQLRARLSRFELHQADVARAMESAGYEGNAVLHVSRVLSGVTVPDNALREVVNAVGGLCVTIYEGPPEVAASAS